MPSPGRELRCLALVFFPTCQVRVVRFYVSLLLLLLLLLQEVLGSDWKEGFRVIWVDFCEILVEKGLLKSNFGGQQKRQQLELHKKTK